MQLKSQTLTVVKIEPYFNAKIIYLKSRSKKILLCGRISSQIWPIQSNKVRTILQRIGKNINLKMCKLKTPKFL